MNWTISLNVGLVDRSRGMSGRPPRIAAQREDHPDTPAGQDRQAAYRRPQANNSSREWCSPVRPDPSKTVPVSTPPQLDPPFPRCPRSRAKICTPKGRVHGRSGPVQTHGQVGYMRKQQMNSRSALQNLSEACSRNEPAPVASLRVHRYRHWQGFGTSRIHQRKHHCQEKHRAKPGRSRMN